MVIFHSYVSLPEANWDLFWDHRPWGCWIWTEDLPSKTIRPSPNKHPTHHDRATGGRPGWIYLSPVLSEWYGSKILKSHKSAHTALAVKACLFGGNSYTKCSITFVNIAVAISALAGGGAKNGFAPRPEFGGVCDIFRGFLGVWAQEGIEMEFWVILVAFRQWKNGQKWKKHCT